ncbi:uncharacterized protein LOC112091391 [Morus notabilis]|uniref:uncharacterized protein LOC112091391 n=1 Tax=Morus notabilis TaxID=981085 RepID=UPI000CED7029|nr:uncharacterized protein LOC112091391 [Morus notabilis]
MARGGGQQNQQNYFNPLSSSPPEAASASRSNYNTWRRSMLMALNAKNKVGFVDGTLLRPSAGDLTFNFFSRSNSMVASWLLNLVSKEIGDSLLYLDSVRDIWIDLYDRFHQSNAPQIFQIKKLLLGLSQGSLDVNTYYTRLKIL